MEKKKIIVVDDEHDLLLAVTLTLRRAGYSVAPAGNGTYAFNLIEQAEKAKAPIETSLLPILSFRVFPVSILFKK